jgi:hypothetical protein
MKSLFDIDSARRQTRPLLASVLTMTAVALLLGSLPGRAAEPAEPANGIAIAVYKTPNCGCCGNWVSHLEAAGFEVEVNSVPETASVRQRLGVPEQLASCHTAQVGDYWVEGHVPADLILRLLAEHPENIRGIAAPGMPPGSPGMESPYALKRYDVVSVGTDGQLRLYARPEGQTQP